MHTSPVPVTRHSLPPLLSIALISQQLLLVMPGVVARRRLLPGKSLARGLCALLGHRVRGGDYGIRAGLSAHAAAHGDGPGSDRLARATPRERSPDRLGGRLGESVLVRTLLSLLRLGGVFSQLWWGFSSP